ncbi:MAG: PAS domain S-box protein, partial [Desulfobacteraceae bacterium]
MAAKKTNSGRNKKANSKIKAIPKYRSRKANYAEKINLTLFHIANAVNIAPDLDELYATIHKILSDVIDVTNFFIALYDKKSDVITFPFQRDEKDKIEDYGGGIIYRASQSDTLTGRVVNAGRPVFFQRKQMIEVYRKLNEFGSVSEQWLGVPLRVKGEIIGVMVVQSYTDPAHYNQQDADLLLAVSDQIALAIELKRALDVIKESEKRYRTLAEKTNDVVFSIDAEGYFTEISPAIENITGYSREEIVGHLSTVRPAKRAEYKKIGWYRKCLVRKSGLGLAYEHFIHPDDQEWVSLRISEAVEKCSAYHLDYRLIKKNGRVHWISERGVVYENEAGHKQIEGMLQDIHKRKHAEDINQVLFSISNAVNTTRNLDELYGSIHSALSRIIDAANFFIGLYNKQTDSIFFPFFIDEYDFHNDPAPELKNISNPKSGSLSGKVLRTGKPLLIKKKERLEWIKKDQLSINLTPAEVWLGVPLKISNAIIGVMAVQDYHDPNHYDEHDIDVLNAVSDQIALAIERRRSEDALKGSKERYQHLVDNIDDIIFAVDGESRFSYLSPSVEAITGYRVRDFKGRIINWDKEINSTKRASRRDDKDFSMTRLFESIIHPDDQKTVLNIISESAQNQAHYAVEYRIVKKNGRTHWVYEKGTPYRDAEQGKGIEGIIQDIHKRKHAEEVNRVL